MQTTTTEYRREYNKENYKRVQVYISKKEYEKIEKKLKEKDKNIKISGYIKGLILKDLGEELGGGIASNE